MLAKWRRAASSEGLSSPEARGLAPQRPSRDQELLWSVQELSDELSLVHIMGKLLPHMRANHVALERVAEIKDGRSAHLLLGHVAKQKLLSPTVRARVTANVRGLISLIQADKTQKPRRLIFPRFGGRSDYAANAAICDLNSNSIGLT
jgi:hypothetical protein